MAANPEIIFLDNHILAVNKPSGLLTQPSGTRDLNLEDLCKEWLKIHFQKPGNVFLEAVHRLDKSVSGIVIFARTSKALSRLNLFQREHYFKKTYLALVESIDLPLQGVFEDYLVHDDYRAVIADQSKTGAKYCRLDYRIINKNNLYSLVEIDLITGRYHQIRAQFGHRFAPIVGDVKYGASTSTLSHDEIALHHSALSLVHPISRETLEFKSAPSFVDALFSCPQNGGCNTEASLSNIRG